MPSLPGYGFSGPTVERGWHPGRIAAAWAQLMAGLGYDRYVAQGGDWGSFVTHAARRSPTPSTAPASTSTWRPPIPTTEDITPEEQACLDG